MEFKDLKFAYPSRPDVPVLRCVCESVSLYLCSQYDARFPSARGVQMRPASAFV